MSLTGRDEQGARFGPFAHFLPGIVPEPEPLPPDAPVSAERIVRVLAEADAPLSRKEIVRRVRAAENTVGKGLARLVKQGQVVRTAPGYYEKREEVTS